ncbi:hypothetical protein J1N35_034041 [Gossypium stocksii]|uniref:Uncharacterized protein n=1 Tax=Gossypium stocksii TaxID=47602 RepID=A0A9D3URK8_9ROSI|nr:hypothetical protein J1N35_034041 [Gossypium stocksii]
MTGPFKSKKKGRRCKPINSAYTISRPINNADTITRSNSLTNDSHITAFSDYVKCVS